MIWKSSRQTLIYLMAKFRVPFFTNIYNIWYSSWATAPIIIYISITHLSSVNDHSCNFRQAHRSPTNLIITTYIIIKYSDANILLQSCRSCTGYPSRRWIEFKIACLVHQSLAGQAQEYLVSDIQFLADSGRPQLRGRICDTTASAT